MKKFATLLILILSMLSQSDAAISQETSANYVQPANNYFTSEEYTAYKRRVDATILHKMPKKRRYYGYVVEVNFNIDMDGHVGNVELVNSSGNIKYDDAVIKALNKCSFPILPRKAAKESLDYNYRIQCLKVPFSWLSISDKISLFGPIISIRNTLAKWSFH